MFKFSLLSALLSLSLIAPTMAVAKTKLTSVYTPLSAKHCVTLKTWRTGAELECAGIAGFRVHLVDDDARQSLTLIKGNKSYPLNFWSTVSSDFSELGQLIEWRVEQDFNNNKITPHALIVRLKTSGKKPSSDLVIVDLDRDDICVVAVEKPTKKGKQNAIAREISNTAGGLDCRS